MPKRERKNELLLKFLHYFDTHQQCILIRVDNINSELIQKLRLDLEANGCKLMFIKNSLARKALDMRNTQHDDKDCVVHEMYKNGVPEKQGWEKLHEQFREINGCIFSNGNLGKVADLIEEHTLASNGYVGYISDIEVVVPSGQTQIDIKMTNFFQKQNIPTKVQNKKILIEKDVVIIHPGDLVNGTHLKIIELLELCPFKFKVTIKSVWDKGNLFSKEVIQKKDEDTIASFGHAVNHLNALSLELGLPTEGSVQHSISRAAKGLANLALVGGVDSEELATLIGFLKDPSKMLSGGAPTGGAKTEVKVEEKKVEEEAQDVDLGGGLFGDEEDDW